MSKKYMTVLIEREDGDKLPDDLTKAFARDEKYKGSRIVAISLNDEFKRVEELEEAEYYGLDS